MYPAHESVACQLIEFAPYFGGTRGAILFRRRRLREIISAEGPPVRPAKGEALVNRSHRVLYSAVSCGVRPNRAKRRLS